METQKKHYEWVLSRLNGRLHFVAHSHHPWPDCTREAQVQAWEDAGLLLDEKWEKIFGHVLPQAQKGLAKLLNVQDASRIQFFQNTHEFIARLLSAWDWPHKGLRVLTTDSEFYSFERQMLRLQEEKGIVVERVPTEPFATFSERFFDRLRESWDLVFVSHVFFNSGFPLPWTKALEEALIQTSATVVLDGYHAVGAVPVDMSRLQSRVYYISGGYKYLQAGEGVGFAYVPPSCDLRPWNTGWMADFSSLNHGLHSPVSYAQGAGRMAGATFDPVGLYRLNAVLDWWQRDSISVADQQEYVRGLQQYFCRKLESSNPDSPLNPAAWLLRPPHQSTGRFLTWRHPAAPEWHRRLRERGVMTDIRKTSLRFGFGVYHDRADVDRLVGALQG